MKRQRDMRGIRLQKGDTAKARKVGSPPMHERKRLYRARCKATAAGGLVNDASTGNWRQPYASEATTADYSKSGSALRGGATRGGPRPHWEFYEKKIAC